MKDIQTLWQALNRRKRHAIAISATAALAAAGLVRPDDPALPVSAAVAKVVRVEDSAAGTAVAEKVTAVVEASIDLPDIEHPNVDSWIKRFTTSMRSSYATYLERMPKYEPMITKKLEERGMPTDLVYLAMIESGFNPRAKSRVAAQGLWQFMRPTAREYGLRVGRGVDERNNPERATDAALTYLQKLHKRFGSWYLAAAAYNVGQGRVAKVMKQVTGRTKGTDADFYRIASRLPKETRDYVPKLIAAAKIGKNPVKYGFGAG